MDSSIVLSNPDMGEEKETKNGNRVNNVEENILTISTGSDGSESNKSNNELSPSSSSSPETHSTCATPLPSSPGACSSASSPVQNEAVVIVDNDNEDNSKNGNVAQLNVEDLTSAHSTTEGRQTSTNSNGSMNRKKCPECGVHLPEHEMNDHLFAHALEVLQINGNNIRSRNGSKEIQRQQSAPLHTSVAERVAPISVPTRPRHNREGNSFPRFSRASTGLNSSVAGRCIESRVANNLGAQFGALGRSTSERNNQINDANRGVISDPRGDRLNRRAVLPNRVYGLENENDRLGTTASSITANRNYNMWSDLQQRNTHGNNMQVPASTRYINGGCGDGPQRASYIARRFQDSSQMHACLTGQSYEPAGYGTAYTPSNIAYGTRLYNGSGSIQRVDINNDAVYIRHGSHPPLPSTYGHQLSSNGQGPNNVTSRIYVNRDNHNRIYSGMTVSTWGETLIREGLVPPPAQEPVRPAERISYPRQSSSPALSSSGGHFIHQYNENGGLQQSPYPPGAYTYRNIDHSGSGDNFYNSVPNRYSPLSANPWREIPSAASRERLLYQQQQQRLIEEQERIEQEEAERRHRQLFAAMIEFLPTNDFDAARSSTLSDEMKKCTICFEDYEDKDKLRRLPCTHGFHQQCIDCWLQRSFNCPICKHDLRRDFIGAEY